MSRTNITALRKRMAEGTPVEGDLSWCQRRLDVLGEWPEALTREQLAEQRQLSEWVREYAE